ncbi:signal peptide peptidase SppA, partial [Candidatus Woesearchaeota archaeon]
MAKRKKERGIEKFTRISRTVLSAITAIIRIAAYLFLFLLFLGVIGVFTPSLESGNVALIPIKGIITSTESALIQGAQSSAITKLIEKAEEDDDIKAIVFEIDSPGGTPVASDEIARAVAEAKKPTVALIKETGASGAYWIASAADHIVANRMSITGSIGVKASRLEFAGLIKNHNITYRRLVAGDHKDTGSIWREMTEEEREMYQQILDSLHEEFIRAVAENRNLDIEQVRKYADGFVLTGKQALKAGLVDELGGKKEALKYIEETLNITAKTVAYKKKQTLIEQLGGVGSQASYNIGKGIA